MAEVIQRAVEVARFNELDGSWAQIGRVWTRCVFIGPSHDPASPVGVAIRADRTVADRVGGRRSFPTGTMMIVLSGLVMHDGQWLKPGEFYVAPPNDMNGDLLFGPDGAVVFFMFDKRSGMVPMFADPADQANFDRDLRPDVEAVAAGRVEKSVSLLPLRDKYTPGRAIVFNSVEEVERYRAEAGTDW